ncbi:hypothetical protein KM043_006696 [Ampulex compressa]|nr:hypothetical protein KM043_006696 [Ampulex compressa]
MTTIHKPRVFDWKVLIRPVCHHSSLHDDSLKRQALFPRRRHFSFHPPRSLLASIVGDLSRAACLCQSHDQNTRNRIDRPAVPGLADISAMAKTKSTEPEESGMGFKDKQKALDTLKALDERDISYQYHVITSFVSRAKRTLQITKDEEKLANLRDALKVFENWLTDYKDNNRGKENLAYLPIETMKSFRPLAKKYGVLEDDFFAAYKREKGDYKSLRAAKVPKGETTWDIERNRRLKRIIEKIKQEHIQCPDTTKLKKLALQAEEKFGLEGIEDMEIDEDSKEKGRKRNHSESSSSESDEDGPRKKIAKKSAEEDVGDKDTGLGFKDKEKALQSIKSLEGRDISYQFHAIAGLVKRAERVISCTKDEQKIKNMKAAIEVFENWITDYNVNGRSKENFNYLPIDVIKSFLPLAERYNIEDNGFLKAYEEADGDYKKLRSVRVTGTDTTWDVERNKNLKTLVNSMKEDKVEWFETDEELRGLPTEQHTRCIMWGFSHDVTKLKKLIPILSEKLKPASDDGS